MVILEQVLICLIRNSQWPFIHAQAKQNGYQKHIWNQVIQKAITAEAKAALNFLF